MTPPLGLPPSNAAALYRELFNGAMVRRAPFTTTIAYGALASVAEKLFPSMPAGVIAGIYEMLGEQRNENDAARLRARRISSEIHRLGVVPVKNMESFVAIGVALFITASRAVVDRVREENSDGKLATPGLFAIIDELHQDAMMALVGPVGPEIIESAPEPSLLPAAEVAHV